MDTLLNNIISQQGIDGTYVAKDSMLGVIEGISAQQLKVSVGNSIFLQIISQQKGILQSKISPDGQNFIDVNIKTSCQQNFELNRQLTAQVVKVLPQKIEIKFTDNISVNNQPKLADSPLLQIKSSSTPYMHFAKDGIRVEQILSSIVDFDNLSPEIKTETSNYFSRINLLVKPIEIKVLPENENKIINMQQEISSSVKHILQTPNNLPDTTLNQIANVFKNLIGKQGYIDIMPKSVQNSLITSIPNGTYTENIIPTPWGNVFTQEQLNLPQESKLIVEIIGIKEQISPDSNNITDKIVKLFSNIKNQEQGSVKLENIISKLPKHNADFTVNLHKVMQAIKQDDVKMWLGTELVEELNSSGLQGKELIGGLQQILSEQKTQIANWKIIEIPLADSQHLNKIKIAIKQNDDQDSQQMIAKQPRGTRFVIDTNFTVFGEIQFDGFCVAKERRFDLVVRTQKPLSQNLIVDMINLYKKSLVEVKYAGNIKVNSQESFIKIDKDNTQQLDEGFWI